MSWLWYHGTMVTLDGFLNQLFCRHVALNIFHFEDVSQPPAGIVLIKSLRCVHNDVISQEYIFLRTFLR